MCLLFGGKPKCTMCAMCFLVQNNKTYRVRDMPLIFLTFLCDCKVNVCRAFQRLWSFLHCWMPVLQFPCYVRSCHKKWHPTSSFESQKLPPVMKASSFKKIQAAFDTIFLGVESHFPCTPATGVHHQFDEYAQNGLQCTHLESHNIVFLQFLNCSVCLHELLCTKKKYCPLHSIAVQW